MAGERDVLIRLGVKPMGDVAKPLKDLAGETGKADKAVQQLTLKLRTEVIELNRGAEAAKRFTRETQGWTKAQIEGVAALEKTIAAQKKHQQFMSMPGGMQALQSGGKVMAGVMAAQETMNVVGDFAGGNDPDKPFQSRIGQFAEGLLKNFRGFEDAIGLNITGLKDLEKANKTYEASVIQTARALTASAEAVAGFKSARGGANEVATGQGDLAALRAGLLGGGSTDVEAQIRNRQGLVGESQAELARLKGLSGSGQQEGKLSNAGMLADEQARLRKLQEEMLGLEQKRLETMKQEGAERVRGMKEQADQLKQQSQQLKQIAEQERERLAGLKESFGFMKPEDQQAIKDIAKKLAGGGKLTGEETEFAQKKSSFFGEQLRGIGTGQADQAGFAEVAQMLGLDRKAREAEAKQELAIQAEIEVRNKIEVEIKQQADDVAAAIAERIVPIIDALSIQIANDVAARIRNEQIQGAANRRASSGTQ